MSINYKCVSVIFILSLNSLINCNSITYDNDFDYELYFEYDELNASHITIQHKVQSTREILFQPCTTDDGSTGILTRIRDCGVGIKLEQFYYNYLGLYYRIGCCVMSELNIDLALFHYYYNLMSVYSNQLLGIEVVPFTVPAVNGERCETKLGINGVQITHHRCKALIGYIEKSDRHISLSEVPNGCCPAYISGQCK